MKIIFLILVFFVQSTPSVSANSSELLAYAVAYEQAPPVEKRVKKKRVKKQKHKKIKNKRLRINKPSPNQTNKSSRVFYILAITLGALFLLALIVFLTLFLTGGSGIGMLLILIMIAGVGFIALNLGLIFLFIAIGLRKKGK